MSDLPEQRPRLRWIDPYRCNHPKLVALWRFRGRDDVIYRCMVCGMRLSTSDLEGREPWQRGRRISR
jgi:hypothetical protein